jgi:hypothetical protein
MADPAYIVDGVLTDGEAWVGIATTTVSGTSTATITFTSPDDGSSTDWSQFMDLILISHAAGEAVGGTNSSYARFNSDTGSNYPYQWLYADGASVTAASGAAGASHTDRIYFDASPGTASPQPWGCSVLTMFDINSGKYKSAISQFAGDRDGAGMVGIYASTWQSQAAINRIDIACAVDYLPDSTFSLFGVLPRMVA